MTSRYEKDSTFWATRENIHQKSRAARRGLRYNPSKNKLSLLLVIAFLSFLIFSYGGHLNQLGAMEQELNKIQMEVEELRKKNMELKEQLEKVKSREYVEQVAREKLGLIREGEVLVVPVDPANARLTPPPLEEKIRD